MASGSNKLIKILLQELIYRRNFIIIAFSLISIILVTVGANWPKMYTSSTTVFVEEENILGPLMEGAAVQTEVIDRAAIAREIIFGHKIMFQLLQQEGLVESNPDPVIQERLINTIKNRMNISNVRRNLINIEFTDNDPERSFRITSSLAKLFIQESFNSKAQQSTDAFEFIDKQASVYKEKLQLAEAGLKQFRSENIDAQPGMPGEIGRRAGELQRTKEQITQELKEANIRKVSLEKQLSGEAKASSAFSRAEHYKTRIAEMQAQLDDLRLSYHETYPDIVRIKKQINDLRDAIKVSEKSLGEGRKHGDVIIDERVLSNPVYQQLQRDLYNAKTLIETLEARLDQANVAAKRQLQRARKVEEYEARLQELSRDYEVNHESYIDLMRRREQARVSMNLDMEGKGLSLRIDEPAYYPHSPTGIRFFHFLLAGPLIGLGVPIGIIFLFINFDPRIRSENDIYENIGIPVLGATPHLLTPKTARIELFSVIGMSIVLVGTIAFVMAMAILQIQK